MAEFPALPFFTDAYLADTRHLTTEEHGAYLLLLMCTWRTRGCVLKANDRQLARIAGVSPTKWRRLKPVLAEFFTVSDGIWRQKKLTYVHESVSKKVARNRQNGALGGRATAAKQQKPVGGRAVDGSHDNSDNGSGEVIGEAGRAQAGSMGAGPSGAATGFQAGWHLNRTRLAAGKGEGQTAGSYKAPVGDDAAASATEGGSKRCSDLAPKASSNAAPTAEPASPATKTKAKTKISSSSEETRSRIKAANAQQHVPGQGQKPQTPYRPDKSVTPSSAVLGYCPASQCEIAAAAGLELQIQDSAAMALWHAAGANVTNDILPVLAQISAREIRRTGARPARLAYYSNAVIEARDRRLGATTQGAAHATANPARPQPVEFQKTKLAHWRKFLGDPNSKFRGDYISKNWRIPNGHPDFKSAYLGADPKHAVNGAIPDEIYGLYGPGWGWLLPAKE